MKKSCLLAIFKENKLFFYGIAILLFMGVWPLLVLDKVKFFMFIKQWNHPIMDQLTPYLTYIGDGITYGCLLLIAILLRVNYRDICIMAGSFGIMSFVVQLVFKHGLCAHVLRPTACIPLHTLHIVPGVTLEKILSFPSGHTATIFVLISLVQLLYNKRKNAFYTFSLLLLAMMVAYSRIYLCQHFYTDVYAGACIGIGTTLLVYVFFYQE